MIDTTFYMGYARERPHALVEYIEQEDIPILVNASTRWSEPRSSFLDQFEYDTRKVIDAGGYNVQSSYGEYPWNVIQYHNWLTYWQDEIEWACVMDYACEERFDDQWSVDERIEMTIDNTIRQFNLEPDYELLPVLQGRSIEGYLKSYDKLVEHGIPIEHVGLGTVCRISNSKEILNTVNQIKSQTSVDRIHGFGVKINALKMGIELDSMDSFAWINAPKNIQTITGWDRNGMKKERCEDSEKRTIQSFKNYYEYVDWLTQNGGASERKEKELEQIKSSFGSNF